MGNDIPLGRIRGIKVGASWTTILIIALISFNVSSGLLPAAHPEASQGVLVLAGLLGAVAVLASILAHEIAHAVVAQRNGIRVKSISLWALGGVAQLDGEPESPGADFRIAAVGPLTSLGLGLAFGMLWIMTGLVFGPSILVTILYYLAIVNVALAIFNVIPASPLDGGRILRAAVWKASRNRGRAVAVASWAGQALGALFMVAGTYWVVGRDDYSGLWYLVLGFFMYSTAKGEGLYTKTTERLSGQKVEDVLPSGMAVVKGLETPVSSVVFEVLPLTRLDVLPVLLDDGNPVGVVRRQRMMAVPAEERGMPVGMLLEMAGRTTLEATLLEAARNLGPTGVVLVHGPEGLRGVLTAADLDRAIAQR